MTISADPEQGPPVGAEAERWRPRALQVAIAILLLSLLYLMQITIARGWQGGLTSVQLIVRSAFEWLAWLILLPALLGLERRFPVGPGRPRWHLAVLVAGGFLAMPLWAVLVGLPVSALRLPLWGLRAPAGFATTTEIALLQRGAYLVVIYGLIIGLATAYRLAREKTAAAARTATLRHELAAAGYAEFEGLMKPDELVPRLEAVARAMEQSPEQAEADTLALADDLHTALIQSRTFLSR